MPAPTLPLVRERRRAFIGQLKVDRYKVTYETSEPGRFETVVQPIPNAAAKWPVSTTGGVQPRWRADGSTI